MHRFQIAILAILLIAFTSKAQNSDYKLIFELKGLKAELIRVDNLGNLYVLEKQSNALSKWDENGQKLFEFSEFRYGKPTIVDVTNPFKVLVFYPDFQRVIILDNTLAKLTEIDLVEYGYFDVMKIALSNDNHLWIYDPVNYIILKLSDEGEILHRSNDLQLELGQFPGLDDMIERNNLLFVLDNEGDLFVFNSYARFLRKRMLGAIAIYPMQNELYYLDGDYNLWKDALIARDSGGPSLAEAYEKNKSMTLDGSVNSFADHLGIRYYKRED